MSTDEIDANASPQQPYVDEDLVAAISRLLDEAKAGRVINVAIATTTKDTQDRADDNQVWYVVNGRCWDADDIRDPFDTNWTVSTNPTEPGWNTDGGHPGYGLTRADAEFLAAAANEKIERERRK